MDCYYNNTKCQPLLACLMLGLLASATATDSPPRQQATCKLDIQGPAVTAADVAITSADLACNTSDGRPLVVGVSSRFMRGWATPFFKSWTGVTVEQDLACGRRPDEMTPEAITAAYGLGLALLYFCGEYNVHLDAPVVYGLRLADSPGAMGPPGAVLLFGGGGNATVTNGFFVDNQHSGSLLHVDGRSPVLGKTHLTVRNCTFFNNSAWEAAALYATYEALADMHNCTAVRNRVATRGGAVVSEGFGTLVSIHDSDFRRNSADRNGGAVVAKISGEIEIYNSTFHRNRADQLGGTIESETAGKVKVHGCSITNSYAGLGGAVACDSGWRMSIQNNTIIQNNVAFAGGGMFLIDCSGEVINSSIIGNACNTSCGGGIDFRGTLDLDIEKSTISDNYVASNPDSAGGVYGATVVPITASMESIEGMMRVVAVSLDDESSNFGVVTINDSVISNNWGYVGGLSVPANYTAALSGNVFSDNIGELTGGVMSLGNVSVWGGAFRNNTGTYGGALSTAEGTMLVEGSKIVSNQALVDGGGLYAINNTYVIVTEKASVSGNVAGRNGGGFVVADGARLQFSDSTLESNTASGDNALRVAYGGGGMLRSNAHVDFVDSDISNNTAESGGGVYAVDTNTVLSFKGTNNITGNKARNGGGIAIVGARFSIAPATSIIGNTASSQAGGLLLESDDFDAAQVLHGVHNNTAPLRADVGVTPSNIYIDPQSPNQGGLVTLLTDDGLVPLLIAVSGVNGVPCDGEALFAVVTDSDTSRSFSVVNISQSNGTAWFNLALAPGAYLVDVSHKLISNLPHATLSMELESCNPGQVLASTSGMCQLCPQGTFSLQLQTGSCQQCPVGAECPGGAVLLVNPGFWRSSAKSDQIHRCGNPSACSQEATVQRTACITGHNTSCDSTNKVAHLDMEALTAQQCSTGYEGNLCGVCAVGYGASKPFSCRKCLPRRSHLAVFIVSTVVLLLLIRGLCYFTVQGIVQNNSTGLAIPQREAAVLELSCGANTGRATSATSPKAQPTELLKSLVLYLQYMLIIASRNIQWPASILYPFQVLAWVFSSASPETFSVDCLFTHNTGLPLAIKKTIFFLAMPIVMLIALLLFEVAAHGSAMAARFCRKQPRLAKPELGTLSDRLLSYAVVMLFFFLPSLARTTLSLFACVLLDVTSTDAAAPHVSNASVYAAVGRFWMLDMNQQCYSGYHKGWSIGLGVALLFLLCVALPAAVIGLAVHSRNRKQTDPEYVCHYSFLREPYKTSLCFWEGILAVQTQGLVAISVFGFTLGPYYQTLAMHAAIASILLLLMVFDPFERRQSGLVMQQGMFCLLFTTYVALSFVQGSYLQPTPMYGLVMGGILAALNLLFVLSVVIKLVRVIDWPTWWRRLLSVKGKLQRMMVTAATQLRTFCCRKHKESPGKALLLTQRQSDGRNNKPGVRSSAA